MDPHDDIILGGVRVGHVRQGQSTDAGTAVSNGDGFHDISIPAAKIAGMPGPSAGSAISAGSGRTLAQVYRRFGEVDAAGTSPLYERVAVALSESGEALRAIEAAPARKRHPTVILAARPDAAPCCIRPLPRQRDGQARMRSG
jgi:hypothetical protein